MKVKTVAKVAGAVTLKAVDLAVIGLFVTTLFDFACITVRLIRGNK